MTPAPEGGATLPLHQRMYLLSYDTTKNRVESASVLVRGVLLRGAAVFALAVHGQLRDRDGRAERAAGGTAAPDDPLLADILADAAADKPPRWFHLVHDKWWDAEETVRDQLAASGVATVERDRALGLIPRHRVTLTDPRRADELRARVRSTLLEPADPTGPADGSLGGAALEDAVLAVLAVEGTVATVFTLREVHAHRREYRALADRVDAAVPGVRAALRTAVATRRGAAS